MSNSHRIVLVACAAVIASVLGLNAAPVRAADDAPIEAKVTVDATTTLRTMDPHRLGGTNIATWIDASTYASPEVRQWIADLRSTYMRLPGGSGANMFYWNGNGVRGADGRVDPSKVGPDGYPAVDYSGYAPSFSSDPKTLHPASGDWHGNVDVKTLHEFIQAMPGAQAMACSNAGTGRAIDAAEWVKWANKKMGYNVRVWEIGNELDGSWEPGYELPFGKGHITAEMYTKRYNDMASAMRKEDPTIKIGSCPFVKEALRDCGENVDFVSIHTYPGSTTMTDSEMFADISKTVERETSRVKQWIEQYQPQRKDQIELAYTEWNLGFSVSASEMFSGLWASIFLGEMAKNGVDMATQWDCFTCNPSVPDGHGLIFGDGEKRMRKAQYYALWLWNNYMGNRLMPAKSDQQSVYTYASRSDDAAYVMLINTDHDREAKVSVQLSGFPAADEGEIAMVTPREYHWNALTRRPMWSTGPRVERLKTGQTFSVAVAPFSMAYVRVPDKANPGLSPIAQKALAAQPPASGTPELRFIMPTEAYVGDVVWGEVIGVESRSELAYRGSLVPASIQGAGVDAEFDRTHVRLAESVGRFSVKPSAAGQLTITARSGETTATHAITIKPSTPRPVIFWDFTNPPVTDKETFSSHFKLAEDLTQRANRAVARVDLPSTGVVTEENSRQLLQVKRLPDQDKLKKENIRGVMFDFRTSADFQCDDPNASITVTMQSPAEWWMVLGDVPLKDAQAWQTHQMPITLEKYLKAMPSTTNVWFVLKSNKPVKGSIYFDKIGFLVR